MPIISRNQKVHNSQISTCINWHLQQPRPLVYFHDATLINESVHCNYNHLSVFIKHRPRDVISIFFSALERVYSNQLLPSVGIGPNDQSKVALNEFDRSG